MRSVLISGAARGYGYALVEIFYREKWQVYAIVRRAEDVEKLRRSFPSGCKPILADVTEDSSAAIISAHLTAELDLVINNAGIGDDACYIAATTYHTLQHHFNVHCVGAMRCIHGALPHLNKSSGIIINVSSRFGLLDRVKNSAEFLEHFSYAYPIAKASQNMLTLLLSRDPSLQGLTICGIHPGVIKTSLGRRSATQTPQEAANIFWRWFEKKNNMKNGEFYDLSQQEVNHDK